MKFFEDMKDDTKCIISVFFIIFSSINVITIAILISNLSSIFESSTQYLARYCIMEPYNNSNMCRSFTSSYKVEEKK
jgi:nucleoside permease NupC